MTRTAYLRGHCLFTLSPPPFSPTVDATRTNCTTARVRSAASPSGRLNLLCCPLRPSLHFSRRHSLRRTYHFSHYHHPSLSELPFFILSPSSRPDSPFHPSSSLCLHPSQRNIKSTRPASISRDSRPYPRDPRRAPRDPHQALPAPAIAAMDPPSSGREL